MNISRKKILAVILGTLVLYNGAKWAWGEAAQAYYNYRCETDAGEFIYRTVENVEGVFQMRPRDPRDYFDRLRKRDIPEDPYGHTNSEAQRPWVIFVRGPDEGRYNYLESTKGPDLNGYEVRKYKEFEPKPIYTGEQYWLYTRTGTTKYGSVYIANQTSEIKSRYGFTWEEINTIWDRLFGIYGGELIVKELETDEVLGIRRGFFLFDQFSNKSGICPVKKSENSTYYFLKNVLVPVKHNLSLQNIMNKK